MPDDAFLPLFAETRALADRFTAAGKRLYLVGGIVRDTLLGRIRAELDIDLTTDATPDEIETIVRSASPSAVWTQGKRFGTIGAHFRAASGDGVRAYEITTHRADSYATGSRKPEVRFATVVVEDLARRDFSINAMAVAVTLGSRESGGVGDLIDPFGGARDLADKRLCTPLSAEVSFSDDPLRMLRAARFIAGFGLSAVPEITDAVASMRGRLSIVSAERIRDELDKLLIVDDPSPGLWFLVGTGLAGEFLPELPALALEQDPLHRHKDVLRHTIAVVAKTRPERVLRLAALMHDIAKPRTRKVGPDGVSFHLHDVIGAHMTRDRMRALKYSNEDIDDVSTLVALHLRVHTYAMGWSDAAVRRYVRDSGPLLPLLNELTRCDTTTRDERYAHELSQQMDELESRIAAMREREDLGSIQPDLDGNEIMAHLGLGPGRDVGAALAMLLDARLEHGPLGKVHATEVLDAWWATRSSHQDVR